MTDHAGTIGDILKHTTREHGDKTAFVCNGAGVSFVAFNARVNRLCNALSGLGLVKGDRVAFISRNRTECVEVYGSGKAGFVGMPLNWRLTPLEMTLLLKNSGATVIFADKHFAPVVDGLRTELPELKHFIAFDPPLEGWISYEDFISEAQCTEPSTPVSPEDPLCLFYTSGTTGTPKGVVLTHRGLMQNSIESAFLALKFTPADISLAVMPLFHVGGMWYHLFPSYVAGCTTIIEESFDPLRTLDVFQNQKVTNIHLVPTMIGALLNVPGVEKLNLENLRLMYYAGSNIPEEMLRRAMSVFKKTKFLQAYGSTEGGTCTVLTPEDHDEAVTAAGRAELLCSCGKPYGEIELRVIDPLGEELPEGQIGEVAVLSKRTMQGYWKNPDADRNAIQDGWVRLGDLAYRDKDGYLFIVGRGHDMIVTGGENVFPFEVENGLYQNPKILEAAVFGIPDPRWVEAVAAAVVLQDGVLSDAEELIRDCKTRMAGYKCPKVIFFVDSLPKSPAGKVLKRKLRENFRSPQ